MYVLETGPALVNPSVHQSIKTTDPGKIRKESYLLKQNCVGLMNIILRDVLVLHISVLMHMEEKS